MASNAPNPVVEWLNKYPEPVSVASRTAPQDVLKLIKESPESTVILDLRNERAPSILQQSLNIPATGVDGYEHISDAVLNKITEHKPTVKHIVVHCNRSRQRASKIAGWIQDHINENNVKNYEVTILDGGITGWVDLDEPYQEVLIPFTD
ncbi:uncharacterized protein RJT21DRAFT_10938 [Scheffersomyces amazonensis]|uniref:uncharacterized protein n=1 Tax=Scheffersomyces amazonensis TaxID=1078765 RepID=UPI00315CEEAC